MTPVRLIASMANEPEAFTNGFTTSIDLDALTKFAKEAFSERDRINADMVSSLDNHIAADGRGLAFWAEKLRVDFVTLTEVLEGKRQPDWYFWEQVERVFRA